MSPPTKLLSQTSALSQSVLSSPPLKIVPIKQSQLQQRDFIDFKKAMGCSKNNNTEDDQQLTERNSERNNGPVLKRNIITNSPIQHRH